MDSTGSRFLENIQELLIYLKAKGFKISLYELLTRDEGTLEYLVEQYKEDHEEVLNQYFERKKNVHALMAYHDVENYLRERNINAETLTEDVIKRSEELFNKAFSKYESSTESLPSKFQSLNYFQILNPLLQDLIFACKELGYELPPVVLGSVSTGSVNACAIAVENDEAVVILEEDILSFIHLFCKIFVLSTPLRDGNLAIDKESVISKIKEDENILFRFKDFMMSYVIHGSPRESEPYYLDFDESDPRYQICTFLMMATEYFIVAHELGHIIAGHQKERRKVLFMNENNVIRYNQHNWDKEYEADNIGMQLTIQTMMQKHEFNIDFGYVGVELFFIVHEFATKAFKIVREGNEDIINDKRSHPIGSLRIENTRNILRESLNDDELYLHTIFFPDIFKEIFEYLWSQTKHVFYEAYDAKHK